MALRRIATLPNVFYCTVFHILLVRSKSKMGPKSEQKDTNKVAKRKSRKAKKTIKALSLM